MSEFAIRAEAIGKKYLIHHQQPHERRLLRYTLTHALKTWARRTWNWRQQPLHPRQEVFWALRDLSFEIAPGDRVGIIGRNGAGKSTLLKILSRITEPTTGCLHINGRVASLLEVGTGFHPELTGRENIYLNGAILGMSRAEIRRKFDEIVDFAEVEKFLDTPVKRYSSGMYVRLAFAVAAHLEPDVLLIDEVLAVGDVKFQKKCLGKMQSVGKAGHTVIFVSHQMGMVTQLCDSVYLLDHGHIVRVGPPETTITEYLKGLTLDDHNTLIRDRSNVNLETAEMYLRQAETCDRQGILTSEFGHTEAITLRMIVRVHHWCSGVVLGVSLKDVRGRRVFTTEAPLDQKDLDGHQVWVSVTIPEHFLTPGMYSFLIGLHVPNVRVLDRVDEVCRFTITDLGSSFAIYGDEDYGCVFAQCDWQFGAAIKEKFQGQISCC